MKVKRKIRKVEENYSYDKNKYIYFLLYAGFNVILYLAVQCYNTRFLPFKKRELSTAGGIYEKKVC